MRYSLPSVDVIVSRFSENKSISVSLYVFQSDMANLLGVKMDVGAMKSSDSSAQARGGNSGVETSPDVT